jgi:hypothetical protein
MRKLLVAAIISLGLLGSPALAEFNGIELFQWTNISATPTAFTLRGGQYAVTVIATFGGGSVTLQRLADDGSTYVTCLTAITANGYATVNLPSGTYKLTIATATAVYADVTSVVTVQ